MKKLFTSHVSFLLLSLGFAGIPGAATLHAACSAGFTYTISGKTVTFTNTSTGSGLSSQWAFDGPSGFSNSMSPTWTFSNPGYHYVCLTVHSSTDPGCNSKICDSIFIPGTSPCSAVFAITNDSTAPVPAQVWFNALGSQGANLIYIWEYDDGSAADTTVYGAGGHIVLTPGLHTVCLTVVNLLDSTCRNKVCHTFKAGPKVPCNANFYQYPDTTFAPWTLHFHAAYNQPGTTYSWNFGDGSTGSGITPTHTYDSTGYYLVCLTITNLADSCTATHCDSVYAVGNTHNPTGLAAAKPSLNIHAVYPNPAKNVILLELEAAEAGSGSICIYNVAGEQVQSAAAQLARGSNQLQADVSSLAQGIYLIQVNTAKGAASKPARFVK